VLAGLFLIPALSSATTADVVPLRLDPAELGAGPVPLDGWYYRPGDGPVPQPSDLGEDGWRRLDDTAHQPRERLPEWPGIGWFVLPVEVPPELAGGPLAVRLEHPGASELFVDGERVAAFGTVAATAARERPHDPHGVPVAVVIERPGRHLLAVRYSCTAAAHPTFGRWLTLRRGTGFRALLDLPDRAFREVVDRRTLYLALNVGAGGLALGFAVLHGLIFLFHRRHRGNLWFALFACAFAVNGFSESLQRWGHFGLWGFKGLRLASLLSVGVLLLSLVLFLGSLRPGRSRRVARWLAVGFVPVALTLEVPALHGAWQPVLGLWYLASVAVALWLGVVAWRERAEGARALGLSAVGWIVLMAAEIVKQAGHLSPAVEVAVYGAAILLLLTGASLVLARRIAGEGRELERLAQGLEDRVVERTAELRRSEREARAASRAKSSFLATMSHEIRTPMNAILGLSELLAGSGLTDDQRRMADTLHRSAGSLLTLINEVLDLSRIESGRLDLEHRAFDLEEVVRESVELFATQAASVGLALGWRLEPGVPPTVVGDPARLRQILVNLIGNALKFTPEGRVEVVVAEEDEGLRIEVRDTGIGIAPEAVEQLFEPFFQVDGSATRRHEGAGLGLAICQRLVELMDGTITVESERGAGSTFRVVLPMPAAGAEADAADAALTAPAPAERGAGDGAGDGEPRPLRILLAEDNPVNQLVTTLMLERLGYDTDVVDRGPAVLEAVAEKPYDVVLLDLHMPEMDGVEVGRRIRAELGRRSPYLLAVTASALAEDRERCRQAGIDDFLAKPVQLEALRSALRRAVTTLLTVRVPDDE
jgi:signal transduction histidine kinase/ActR/RegA family two-component response regulator